LANKARPIIHKSSKIRTLAGSYFPLDLSWFHFIISNSEEDRIERGGNNQGQNGGEAQAEYDDHGEAFKERVPQQWNNSKHSRQHTQNHRAHSPDCRVDDGAHTRFTFQNIRVGLIYQNHGIFNQHTSKTEHTQYGHELQRCVGNDKAKDDTHQSKGDNEIDDYRLPNSVKQKNYNQNHGSMQDWADTD